MRLGPVDTAELEGEADEARSRPPALSPVTQTADRFGFKMHTSGRLSFCFLYRFSPGVIFTCMTSRLQTVWHLTPVY